MAASESGYFATDTRRHLEVSAKLHGDIPALTGLRFIAAVSVVVAHGADLILRFDGSSVVPTYWMKQMAGLGMGLFFVLSGFVIHYNYRTAVTQGGLDGVGGFIWARFARLYPLYLLVIMLDIILGRKLYEFMAGTGDGFFDVLRALPYFLTFTQSWQYLPFPQDMLVFQLGDNAALTWSISTEWFFYLSYPLVALLVIRSPRPLVTIIVALVWCAVWIALVLSIYYHSVEIDVWAIERYGSAAAYDNQNQDSFFRWLMALSPYLRIGEFILGCIIAQLYIQLQSRSPDDRERVIGRRLLGVGVVSVPILIYIMYSSNVGFKFIKELNFNFGLAPSVALIIFCAARYDTWFSRILNTRPLVALGEASYSIYLIHFLVFNISAGYLGGALPATLPNAAFLLAKFLYLTGLIILVSLGLHAYVEAPARQWLRGLWRQTQIGGQRKPVVAWSILASPGVAAALIVAMLSAAVNTSTSVADGVRVLSATYGANCGARRGNSTTALRRACDGKDSCNYVVDVDVLGDPAAGCSKDFVVDYQCAPDANRLARNLPAEAGLKSSLLLSCAPNAIATASEEAPPALSARANANGNTAPPLPAPSNLPVRSAAANVAGSPAGIKIRSATYGGNCGAEVGNATSDAQLTCDGDQKCTYKVDAERLGDPAPTCAKAFALEYECAPGGKVLQAEVAGEAGFGKTIDLQCPSGPGNNRPSAKPPAGTRPLSAGASSARGIGVLAATYGGNCGAPAGNATAAVESACSGRAACNYTVDVNTLGDPAPRCAKGFFVKFQCGGDTAARTAALRGEAGLGSLIHLACP